MIRSIWTFISKRHLPLLTVGVIGLTYLGYFTSQQVRSVEQTTSVRAGVNTCFSRVAQSFTASVIGDRGSNYLAKDFTSTTEECFADALSSAKAIAPLYAQGGKVLNNLASDVHWFHEKLQKSATDEAQITSRFEALDEKKRSFLDVTESVKEQFERFSLVAFWSLMAIGAFLSCVTIVDFLNRRHLRYAARQAEQEARELLKSQMTEGTLSKVEELVTDLLKEQNLIYCAELVSAYHSGVTNGKIMAYMKPELDIPKVTLERPAQTVKMPEVSAAVVANDSSAVEEKDVHLTKILSSVVDTHSSKIFAHGVGLNIDLPQDLFVKGKEETVEQVLYHLVSNAITASGKSEKPQITVKASRLGQFAHMEIQDSGAGFSDTFLVASKKGETNLFGTGLRVVQELMRELGGKLRFENQYKDGNIIGAKVVLDFEASSAQVYKREHAKKLVDVRRGKKRELLSELKLLATEEDLSAPEKSHIAERTL